jgi:hypothetical protein
MAAKKKTNETFKVNGSELVEEVKQLLHEGNVRKMAKN